MELDKIIERFKTIASDWNGEDDKYTSGGVVYTEDHANIASDIVDRAESIKKEKADHERLAREIAEGELKLQGLIEEFNA